MANIRESLTALFIFVSDALWCLTTGKETHIKLCWLANEKRGKNLLLEMPKPTLRSLTLMSSNYSKTLKTEKSEVEVPRNCLSVTGVKTFTSTDDSLLLIKSLTEDSATLWQAQPA